MRLGPFADDRQVTARVPVRTNSGASAYHLALVEKVGLPLPVFIRGDDVEYGLRLYMRGVDTIVMPGIAVWHEPFYLKIGG